MKNKIIINKKEDVKKDLKSIYNYLLEYGSLALKTDYVSTEYDFYYLSRIIQYAEKLKETI